MSRVVKVPPQPRRLRRVVPVAVASFFLAACSSPEPALEPPDSFVGDFLMQVATIDLGSPFPLTTDSAAPTLTVHETGTHRDRSFAAVEVRFVDGAAFAFDLYEGFTAPTAVLREETTLALLDIRDDGAVSIAYRDVPSESSSTREVRATWDELNAARDPGAAFLSSVTIGEPAAPSVVSFSASIDGDPRSATATVHIDPDPILRRGAAVVMQPGDQIHIAQVGFVEMMSADVSVDDAGVLTATPGEVEIQFGWDAP